MSAADLLTRELRDDDKIEVRGANGKLRGRYCLDQAGFVARPWDAVAALTPADTAVGIDWIMRDWDKWTARYGTWTAERVSNGERGEVVAFGSWLRIPRATS